MLEKLKNASPIELELWMLSAVVGAIGFGAYISDYLKQFALWILMVGLAVHLYMMYRIYAR